MKPIINWEFLVVICMNKMWMIYFPFWLAFSWQWNDTFSHTLSQRIVHKPESGGFHSIQPFAVFSGPPTYCVFWGIHFQIKKLKGTSLNFLSVPRSSDETIIFAVSPWTNLRIVQEVGALQDHRSGSVSRAEQPPGGAVGERKWAVINWAHFTQKAVQGFMTESHPVYC